MKDGLEAETGESRVYLLVIALVMSLAFHVAIMTGLSDCRFNPTTPVEMRAARKWSREMPTMQVESLKGDPFAAAEEALGRPAAAPVVEDEYHRVERLAEELPANEAPPRQPDEATKLTEMPELPAPQPQAPALRPREEIALVDEPIVPDDAAALPRIVVPDVPRMKGAPDISPPADLLALSTVAKPISVGSSGSSGSSGSASAAASSFDAPAPPIARPPIGGFGDFGAKGGGNGGEDGSAFALGEAAVSQRAKEKAKKSAEKRKEEKKIEEAEENARAAAAHDAAENVPAPKVDVKVVQQAKEAVRELRDDTVEEGAPFEDNVRCSLDWWVDPVRPQFKYFRVRVSSREENPLPVVPKDIVYLLDVSGSIGQDRLRVCGDFVDKSIRALNSGDRFNVAAFRNKVLYLFDDWRRPDKATLDKASAWIAALSAHGSTDVFETLKSVHALRRSPSRPIIALFITDGDATSGMTRSAEIISRFAEMNGGLVSVYMYGVKIKANAYLMDMLAHGNRGDWVRHEGSRLFWSANGLPELAAKFANPVLTDISVVFSESSRVQAHPRRVTNLYKSQPIEIWGLCPAKQPDILFRMRGLNADKAYEGMFRLRFPTAATLGPEAKDEWAKRRLYALVEEYTMHPSERLMRDLRLFSDNYGVPIPYEREIKSGKEAK